MTMGDWSPEAHEEYMPKEEDMNHEEARRLIEMTDMTNRDESYYEGKERTPMYYQDAKHLATTAKAAKERHISSQRFHQILSSLGDLHDQKQRDYGSDTDPFANVRASESFGIPGWVGAVLRANDKMRRLTTAITQLLEDGEINMANEALEDSFDDLAVYAVIARVLYEEENE